MFVTAHHAGCAVNINNKKKPYISAVVPIMDTRRAENMYIYQAEIAPLPVVENWGFQGHYMEVITTTPQNK